MKTNTKYVNIYVFRAQFGDLYGVRYIPPFNELRWGPIRCEPIYIYIYICYIAMYM